MLESLTRLHLITANQLWFYEAIRPQRFSLVPQVLTAKLTPDVSTRETSFYFLFFLILWFWSTLPKKSSKKLKKKGFNDEERKKRRLPARVINSCHWRRRQQRPLLCVFPLRCSRPSGSSLNFHQNQINGGRRSKCLIRINGGAGLRTLRCRWATVDYSFSSFMSDESSDKHNNIPIFHFFSFFFFCSYSGKKKNNLIGRFFSQQMKDLT